MEKETARSCVCLSPLRLSKRRNREQTDIERHKKAEKETPRSCVMRRETCGGERDDEERKMRRDRGRVS